MSTIEVTVKETEPVTVTFLAVRGPYSQVSPSFGMLYGWIGQRGFQPSGPPMGVYFNSPGQVPEDELAWELRGPIAGDVPPQGPDEQGLGVKRLAPIRVASTLHRGPFEGLAGTYEALGAWIAENGHQIAGPAEEVYLSDPAEVAPADLLTEVRFPIV